MRYRGRNKPNVVSIFSYSYHIPTKLREGNVFMGVCHSVHGVGVGGYARFQVPSGGGGLCLVSGLFWGGVVMSGPKSLLRGGGYAWSQVPSGGGGYAWSQVPSWIWVNLGRKPPSGWYTPERYNPQEGTSTRRYTTPGQVQMPEDTDPGRQNLGFVRSSRHSRFITERLKLKYSMEKLDYEEFYVLLTTPRFIPFYSIQA